MTERLTFAAADAVISPNESYRTVALTRGKKRGDDVVVVRSAPDLSRFVRSEPDETLRRGKRYLLAYLGVMGPQDGVDYALRAVQILREQIGREDFHCVFMGAGDVFDEMIALTRELGIDDVVEFTGRVPDEFVMRCLSTADLCLSPDPWNPLNDVSTMNKVVEYMAMARPIVSFELKEARVSAGEAACTSLPMTKPASRRRSMSFFMTNHGAGGWVNSAASESNNGCRGRSPAGSWWTSIGS